MGRSFFLCWLVDWWLVGRSFFVGWLIGGWSVGRLVACFFLSYFRFLRNVCLLFLFLTNQF